MEEFFDLIPWLERERQFSEKAFGPGDRLGGVLDHMAKEMEEVRASKGKDLEEWIDLVFLALDGAWRSTGASPSDICEMLLAKLEKNEKRTWPDWRALSPDKAIEHDRSKDEPKTEKSTLTYDRNDPRLGHGVDEAPAPQNDVYLVLSPEERAKGFVRPVRRTYVHKTCGVSTTMSPPIAETYAANPKYYGSTYCTGCNMHRPVSEFLWYGTTEEVGS